MFFVRSEEIIPCPCCQGHLFVIGSRPRRSLKSSGESITFIVRRMRCVDCHRIHHELPDTLVPYKRYDRDSIEKMVLEPQPAVAADESTLRRIRTWFSVWFVYAVRCLSAIEKRLELPAEVLSSPLQTSLQSSGQPVAGWLANAVRPIVQSNLWVQTRSACLSV